MNTAHLTSRAGDRWLSRRKWMGATSAGVAGFSASGWLDVLAVRAAEIKERPKKKACIVLWLSGGLSQLESFDMKPDATDEDTRGPFKPISTAVPDIQICEHLPKLAGQMKDIALLRGMSTTGEHGPGAKLMHHAELFAGVSNLKPANLGAAISAALGDPDLGMPTHVVFGRSSEDKSIGGAGFLGPKHDAMILGGHYRDGKPEPSSGLESLRPSIDSAAFDQRFQLFQELEQGFAQRHPANMIDAHQVNYRNAVNFMRSSKAKAFSLDDESVELREAYGRNQFGQGCLTARRLVEVGVPFVEVKFNTWLHGKNINGALLPWDTHTDMYESAQVGLPILDNAMSSLITDLKQRGLLDDTLVVCMSEMGREPTKEKGGKGGRGHYPQVWTAALAGAGIKTGLVVGRSSDDGREIADRPISAAELLATICVAVGIDPAMEFSTRDGRPMNVQRTLQQQMTVGAPVKILGSEPKLIHEILA